MIVSWHFGWGIESFFLVWWHNSGRKTVWSFAFITSNSLQQPTMTECSYRRTSHRSSRKSHNCNNRYEHSNTLHSNNYNSGTKRGDKRNAANHILTKRWNLIWPLSFSTDIVSKVKLSIKKILKTEDIFKENRSRHWLWSRESPKMYLQYIFTSMFSCLAILIIFYINEQL